MRFAAYSADGFYDEMFDVDGTPRPRCEGLVRRIEALSEGELLRRQRDAERTLMNLGITFTVYGHDAGTEKIWPFDVVPRVVEATEWDVIERGLKQRITALNMFIDDVYNERKIVRDGIVPEFLLQSGKCFLPPCAELHPPRSVWRARDGHRSGARRRWPVLRAGRQPALPVGRILRAGKPRGDETHVPAGVRGVANSAGGRLSRTVVTDVAARGAASARRSHGRGAHVRAFSIRPISSIRSWPSRWASIWSKAATWW